MRKLVSPILMLFLLVGCNSPIQSFEGTIENVTQNTVVTDCSDTVIRDEKGPIDTIGYACFVEVTNDTLIVDTSNKEINIAELKEGQKVKVILTKKKRISESIDSRRVTATEIKVLN